MTQSNDFSRPDRHPVRWGDCACSHKCDSCIVDEGDPRHWDMTGLPDDYRATCVEAYDLAKIRLGERGLA